MIPIFQNLTRECRGILNHQGEGKQIFTLTVINKSYARGHNSGIFGMFVEWIINLIWNTSFMYSLPSFSIADKHEMQNLKLDQGLYVD